MTFHCQRIPALTIIILLVALFGCKEQNEFAAPPPPMVTVSPPIQKEVTAFADFTGTTEPFESVEIRARVKGYLEKVHFKAGSLVKKGDLLFTIDPKPFNAKLEEFKALLLVARAELNLAKTTLKRKEGAYKDRAISEVEVIQARAEEKKAAAAVEAAAAQVETARLDLSYTRITAPISGRISRNLVDVGNLVGSEGATLLTSIVDSNPIYAYFTVSERELLDYTESVRKQNIPLEERRHPKVFLGLANEEGHPHEGKVDFVDNTLDPATGTLRVRAIFPNPDEILLPGLFARVRIPVGDPFEALLVPEQAIGKDQQGSFLLVVNEKNMTEYRLIKTGPLIGKERVIRSGISAGDRVIVVGMQKARPNMPVNAVEAGKQGPPADTPATAKESGGKS
jgi:RND family efflux transporter MFP subunit